jgi:hypothetical protein
MTPVPFPCGIRRLWRDTQGSGFGFAPLPAGGFSVSIRAACALHILVKT